MAIQTLFRHSSMLIFALSLSATGCQSEFSFSLGSSQDQVDPPSESTGGGTTGGVSGGADGGSVGGTVGGSTGGDSGGSDGGSVGGTDGGSVGGTDGGSVGGTDGGSVGGTDGGSVGGTDGGSVGGTDGGSVGGTDGGSVGGTDGGTVGGTTSGTTGGTDGGSTGGADGGGTAGSTGGTDGGSTGGTDGGSTGGNPPLSGCDNLRILVEVDQVETTGGRSRGRMECRNGERNFVDLCELSKDVVGVLKSRLDVTLAPGETISAVKLVARSRHGHRVETKSGDLVCELRLPPGPTAGLRIESRISLIVPASPAKLVFPFNAEEAYHELGINGQCQLKHPVGHYQLQLSAPASSQ